MSQDTLLIVNNTEFETRQELEGVRFFEAATRMYVELRKDGHLPNFTMTPTQAEIRVGESQYVYRPHLMG